MSHSCVGDTTLSYELTDFTPSWKPGNHPVVLIHGLGGDRSMWIYQVPALCGRFPTIALDLRGHGESSSPAGEWSIAAMARDLVRLLRNLGAEKAHIVGCSLGGAVAQQFAIDHPYAVASLVLADTFCAVPVGAEDTVRDGQRFIEEQPMKTIAAHRIGLAFSDAIDPAVRDYVVGRVARCDKDSYIRTSRALFGFSAREQLCEIAAPTLVMVGELDRVTPPALSEEIRDRISGAQLVRIPEAGHISNMERPAAFNRELLEFLPR